MSFLKHRRKSAIDLSGDTDQAKTDMERKLAPKGSIHGLSGFKSKNGKVATNKSSEDGASNHKAEKMRKRDRKRHKDGAGVLKPSPDAANDYPTFLVHYLGRTTTNAEFGREAVEEPVEQLWRLRERQKLSRVMVNFNPEGLRCWEVTAPFLKPKKDGILINVPLHNITYGIGCNNHPNIFACIVRIDAQPILGEAQMLLLHAFVCSKPDVTQKITYWQLQAYIEAYEELKRKKILRDRRRVALGGEGTSTMGEEEVDLPTFIPVEPEAAGNLKVITEVKIKGKGKVKVKNQAKNEGVHSGPSKAINRLVLPDDIPVSKNNPLFEEDSIFVEATSFSSGTIVHRARIVSRPRCDAFDEPPFPAASQSASGSISSSDEVYSKIDDSLKKSIGNLEDFMDMDPELLKKLMIAEHPELARRISRRVSTGTMGTIEQRLTHQESLATVEQHSDVSDDNQGSDTNNNDALLE